MITSYHLFLNEGVNGSPFNEIIDYDGSSCTYTINAGDLVGTHTVEVGGLYRIKTKSENSIDLSLFSEELIVALARKPETPDAPSFDTIESNRFQNALVWIEGSSIDIAISGYKLYSDNGLPGNRDLVYDGTGETEILRFAHMNLITGTQYYYTLEVLNFNGASIESAWVERPACEVPQNF